MGTIPIISDIIDSIKWLIDFFFNKLPKPLLVLVFLLFLFVTAALTGVVLHVMGIHCSGSNVPMKTSMLDFFGNLNIMESSKDILGAPSYTFEELFPKKERSDIVFYGKLNTTLGFYVDCGENDTDVACKYHLKHGSCYNCTYTDICVAKTLFFCGEYLQVCRGDAYYWMNPLSATGCTFTYAKIPIHFAFNSTTGTYTCVDSAYCGVGATRVAFSQLDDQLKGMNAEPYYQNESARDVNHVVGITCNDYQPTLAFFNIAVLDYRIWVLLILLWVMFTFLTNLGNQSGGLKN